MAVTRIRDRRRKLKDGKGEAVRQRALEGLHDALELMLTRVIEDEVSVDEAKTMLAYLQNEVDAIDPPADAGRRTRRNAKRKVVARKARTNRKVRKKKR
ncbi:MAG: hypothetical protein V3W32_10285 [Gemmatimonadota bacterium]